MSFQLFLHNPEKIEVSDLLSASGVVLNFATSGAGRVSIFLPREKLLDLDDAIRVYLLSKEAPAS